MNKLDSANKYIFDNKDTVKSRPEYHFTPPIGWMNDPNGFTYFNGEYHLFYQYCPYDIFWNNIHWGHATSPDMINWKHQPVAMAPDTIADISGCFSGSAIEKDGELYLMYTGHIDPNIGYDLVKEEIVQQQCLAKYLDNGSVDKFLDNPVLSEELLPSGYYIRDFRDPKLFKRDEKYYCVLAARNNQNRGSILLYSSENLIDWDFVSDIYHRPVSDNTLFECPDMFTLDGKDVMILSIMPCSPTYSGSVKNRVEYIIGKMNYTSGKFEEENRGILDQGLSYYAPQTTEDNSGNRVVIGWACDWSKVNEKFVSDYGYNGIMSLPRVLTIESGKLLQQPVSALKEFESEVINRNNFEIFDEISIIGNHQNRHIHLEIPDLKSRLTIELYQKTDNRILFSINPEAEEIRLFSNYSLYVDKTIDFQLTANNVIDIYIDRHCIEFYVNGTPFTILCYDFNKGENNTIRSSSPQFISNLTVTKITGVDIN